MNLRSLDLNLLPVLEAVYAERSLTRASETLHITQPAVSNALSRLRTHFEDPLFVREGRGVKPTAMAEALMPAVREALDRLRAGLEPRSAFEPSRSTRVFNISARDAGANMLAPELARRLHAEAPGVRLNWSQVARGTIASELASSRLDLAIDVPSIRGGDLESEALMSTPYACVTSVNHSKAGEALSLEDFAALRHVVVSSRREGRSYIEGVARAHGLRITPVMRLPYYMPALEVVRHTDMVLTLPAPLARLSGLSLLDVPIVFPALDSVLYWRRENTEDAAVTWLRGLIREISGQVTASAPQAASGG